MLSKSSNQKEVGWSNEADGLPPILARPLGERFVEPTPTTFEASTLWASSRASAEASEEPSLMPQADRAAGCDMSESPRRQAGDLIPSSSVGFQPADTLADCAPSESESRPAGYRTPLALSAVAA